MRVRNLQGVQDAAVSSSKLQKPTGCSREACLADHADCTAIGPRASIMTVSLSLLMVPLMEPGPYRRDRPLFFLRDPYLYIYRERSL